MNRRWITAGLAFLAGTLWLLLAFPRFHPSTRLGLRYDRQQYLARARGFAAANGISTKDWKGYAVAETLIRNQELQISMPGSRMAKAFPDAQIKTNFLPASGAGATVTLRPDGRPLGWKLPVPDAASKATPKDEGRKADVHKLMENMTGDSVSDFTLMADGVAGDDGMGYKWREGGAAIGNPRVDLEIISKNGIIWEAKSDYQIPESISRQFKANTPLKITAVVIWSIALFLGILIPVAREGGGPTAKALKDRVPMWLSGCAALTVLLSTLIEWDDEMVRATGASGLANEIISMILVPVFIGLMFNIVIAGTVLSARMHPLKVRGFRLLGTRAFFSTTTATELLGGGLFGPLLAGLPLLLSAVLHLPLFQGYDDGLLLNEAAVPAALLSMISQQLLGVIAFLGLMMPLAIRFSSGRKTQKAKAWLQPALMMLFAVLTFAMLQSPFRGAEGANVLAAALSGLTTIYLYFRFGMLGALAAQASAKLFTSAGALLVQPAAGLQSSGWGIVAAGFGLGIVLLVASIKAPEAVAELYGESGAKMQTRSRREELLAEFNVARSAQQQMLPAKPPVLAGYTIAASCDPAKEVGGDLYDFLRLSDGRWGIGVADVSGKGVPAALYMTLTKGLLCAAAQDSGDPRQILGSVNKHLRTVTKKKMFVTMAMGVLEPEARTLEYVRAGHNPVVWRRHALGETRWLGGPGIGLGIAGPALFAKTLAAETIELEPGDALVFYSDGLTEAMNEELEQFGEDRLAAAVERADGLHAEATRDSILKEVSAFLKGGHSQDDLTIAVLRVNPEIGSDGRI